MAKRKMDPVSEAAMDVVAVEKQREELVRQEQEERERRIAECHEMIGRIQGFQLVTEFTTVGNLVWLKQIKESKVYRDIPGVGTWDKFCNSVGLSRSKVDEDLVNLAELGEKFIADVGNFGLGYRDLRKLRKLSSEGLVEIEAEAVTIGEERIPLDPEHREDLQAALEKLMEAKEEVIREKDATIRTSQKLLKSKEDLIRRQEKDLVKYEKSAESKGMTPDEEAFIRRCENAKVLLTGFLNDFDPDINPLPADATLRMRQTYMHTMAWFRRVILRAYENAAAVYGDPQMGEGWIPPDMRNGEPETPTPAVDDEEAELPEHIMSRIREWGEKVQQGSRSDNPENTGE